MKVDPHWSADMAQLNALERGQMVAVHDVVQLDPAQCNWGAVLAVVDRVYASGVRVYILVPPRSDGVAYLRVNHGHYVRVGRAEWAIKDAEQLAQPEAEEAGP